MGNFEMLMTYFLPSDTCWWWEKKHRMNKKHKTNISRSNYTEKQSLRGHKIVFSFAHFNLTYLTILGILQGSVDDYQSCITDLFSVSHLLKLKYLDLINH